MTSHLSFDELIDGSGTHAGCQPCEEESTAWEAVRAGVRQRVGVPPADVLESILTRIDQPQAGTRRRYLIPLSVAAAAAVLAAGGYGAVAARGHSVTPATYKGPASTATLTATGCTGLDLAGGTLTRISGGDLLIKTSDGTQVTVATTSSTAIYRETAGTLVDITDGKRVLVTGTETNGMIAAASVGVLPSTVTQPATPTGLGIGLASGTVTDAHGGGFTVVEADGTRVAVTTTEEVTVINTTRISVTQLTTGEITSAVGTAEANGTLAADTVEQDAVPASTWEKLRPHPPSGLPTGGLPAGLPTPAKPSLSLNDLGCSPAAITTSYLLAAHL
jgi:hypothetical protein